MSSSPSQLIVSVSGIRGIIGESLGPDSALRFALALGTDLAGGAVVLSRDSRPSGAMLRDAVVAGLVSSGCRVLDIGIAPTPTVGIAIRQYGAAGGIQITASHNPAPWNGLKMFGPDGAVLPPERGLEVKKLFESQQFAQKPWDQLGQVEIRQDALEQHLKLVLPHVRLKLKESKRLKVFLDGNGGAGGPLGATLLQELGCDVVAHHCNDDGNFAHEPEPTPAHLVDVGPLVQQSGSAIGFVLDPDSDRLALIDEHGHCISEELTLALAVQSVLKQRQGSVVVNMSTSRMIEDLAKAAGCDFQRSAVGEANVVQLMRTSAAVIGGEGNGGVIDPQIGWVRDPFIGIVHILNLMAEENATLSELVSQLPKYAMLKTKATVKPELLNSAMTAIARHWSQEKHNTLDGLRIDGPDWWLHIRASNTEPIVRIIAEAPTAAEAEALCVKVSEFVQSS